MRRGDGRRFVSGIYYWFMADFGGDEREVIEHLRAYAAPPLALVPQRHTRFDGHAWDWAVDAAA